MPIYEYACKKCDRHIEEIQKMSDKPLRRCRYCGGRLERLLSPVGIRFKGTGWYVTDYGRRRDNGNGAGKSPQAKEKKEEKTTTAETKN